MLYGMTHPHMGGKTQRSFGPSLPIRGKRLRMDTP